MTEGSNVGGGGGADGAEGQEEGDAEEKEEQEQEQEEEEQQQEEEQEELEEHIDGVGVREGEGERKGEREREGEGVGDVGEEDNYSLRCARRKHPISSRISLVSEIPLNTLPRTLRRSLKYSRFRRLGAQNRSFLI
jgi:hypothetical protein